MIYSKFITQRRGGAKAQREEGKNRKEEERGRERKRSRERKRGRTDFIFIHHSSPCLRASVRTLR